MIVNPDIETYLKNISEYPHPVLKEMEELAEERSFPNVGPLVGRLLYALVEFGHVHTVLECGSGFGYSALWMALALPENGNITCIEYDARNIELGKKFFEKAGIAHKVTFLEGDALEIVPTLPQTFDVVMNDIDKDRYTKILPELLKKLRVGGMLITDNVLWKGKVIEENPDDRTRIIQEYNRQLMTEENLWTTIIPLRDGVSLSIKLRGK
ncbi:MAG: O-methyltransferase [Calditrichaeota bacterium]|nr:MAG: O-methyltransferase [Calditrichota bacterium]